METKTREVIFCPDCEWESFDPNDYDQPCKRSGCKGIMNGTYNEKYDI